MAGTSTGAKKGWRTRRGYARFGGSAMHTRKQEMLTVEESARLRKMRGGKAAPSQARPARQAAPGAFSPQDEAKYQRFKAERQAIIADMRNRGDYDPQRLLMQQAPRRFMLRWDQEVNGGIVGRLNAPAPRATRPAPAAPAPRQDKRAEQLRREIAEHEAVVRAFNEKHPGGQIDARDREQRLELQRVSKHYADAIHKRELLAARQPAPAAPAKSSKPVKGQRVKVSNTDKDEAKYQRFKAEREAIIADMRNRGDYDPGRLLEQGNHYPSKYFRRYREETGR